MIAFIFGMFFGAFLGTCVMAWMNACRERDESEYEDDWR